MPVLQDTRLSRSSYPQQQTPRTVSPSTIGTTIVTQQTRGKNPTHTHISVKNIILKNVKLFQHDPTTAEIFAQPLLISYKRDKNLSNFLVESTLKSDHQPGTFKCARVRCRTCPFISNANKISGPWVIVSANTLGMLRLTIKTLLNQSRDISTA